LLPTYQSPTVCTEHELAVDANKWGTSGGNLYYGVSLQILPNRHVIEPPSLIPTGSCGAVLQTTRSQKSRLAEGRGPVPTYTPLAFHEEMGLSRIPLKR